MVPWKAPFLASSATLPLRILDGIKTSLRCRLHPLVINIGNDRPNIKFIVAQLRHLLNSFEDLKLLLDFKTTIVYFENRPDAELACQYLLKELGYSTNRNKIAEYHSVKLNGFKQHILESFRGDNILILLATGTVGMGCDINSVVRVVQYGQPSSLSSLIQRPGRAARDPTLQVVGHLFVPQHSSRRLPQDKTTRILTNSSTPKVVDEEF